MLACPLAFLAAYHLTRTRSLGMGICFVVAIGYSYGILRANFTDFLTYFLFDFAVVGLYLACRFKHQKLNPDPNFRKLKHWTQLLIVWPFVLLFVPLQDYFIQVVGFRGNAFLLPMLLIGAELTTNDCLEIGLGMAFLNIGSLLIAIGEFTIGLERFMPYGPATELIYQSNDVGADQAYRIPATFVSAHAYGGMMVASLPLILAAASIKTGKPWHRWILAGGAFAALLGVFLCATRVHFVLLAISVAYLLLKVRMRPATRAACVLLLCVIAYVVATHERLQRFTTLASPEIVQDRVHTSVNSSFFDALLEYPFGNGLGGGGTSIPGFLQDRYRPPTVMIENEFARIQLELGVVGLALWVGFILWVFSRPRPRPDMPMSAAKTLAWMVCALICAGAVLGTGLLTSIPCSAVLLLMIGWISVARPYPKPLGCAFAGPLIKRVPTSSRNIPQSIPIQPDRVYVPSIECGRIPRVN